MGVEPLPLGGYKITMTMQTHLPRRTRNGAPCFRCSATALVLAAALYTGLAVPAPAVAQTQTSGGALPEPWRVVTINERIKPTQYQAATVDGVVAFEAQADGSMALLARPLEVDLNATPVLCWRWRVERVLEKADMATKAGDDYAARVYVAFALPPEAMSFGVRTQLRLGRTIFGDLLPDAALNYVWDNRYPVGTEKPNAYTDRTRMVVLQSGPEGVGRWVTERRDVRADVVRAFGTDRARPTLLAVAADTDNTGERARSAFADLQFVAADAPCPF